MWCFDFMQISFTKRKVQYLYLGLTIVSVLLGLVSYARAQETTNPGQPAAANSAVQERKASLNEAQQNRFINLVRNVHGRMEAAITRLEDITVRIEARVAKLEAEGVDTAGALAPLADAKNKLAEAKSMLAQAKDAAETGLVSDTPRERFTASREQFRNIRQSIRDAYILLRESVSALKDAVVEAELNNTGVSDAVSNNPETETETEEAATN
jgi:hypothetical protein